MLPAVTGTLEGKPQTVSIQEPKNKAPQEEAKIIVHDKNDPRLKEYKERLRLNKKYLSTKLSELAPPSSPGDPTKKIIKIEEIAYDDAPNDPGKLGSFDKFDNNGVDDPVRGFVSEKEAMFGKDSIKPSYFKKLTIEITSPTTGKTKNIIYTAVYEKPLQKVIYEEPKTEETVVTSDKEPEKPTQEKINSKEISPNEYSMVDKQTKFITSPDGKTKIPYIEKVYYSKQTNKITKVEKLDPVTNEIIP